MTYYDPETSYIAYAIGTDLTAWRNADAALTSGELQATDNIARFSIDHTDPITEEVGTLSASYISDRVNKGVREGSLTLPMYFQRAVFAYLVMGTCTTAGVADPYTHSISLYTDQTPVNFAFHAERELTGENLRHDILGCVPVSWRLSCNEKDWVASQEFTAAFAYSKTGATDIAEPTKLSNVKYNWGHLKHASGQLVFEFNSTAVECDVLGFDITLSREYLLSKKDTNGYPTVGKVKKFRWNIVLDVMPTGDDLRTIAATKLVSGAYAGGDLDLTLKFYDNANDSITLTFDKLYLDAKPEEVDESKWFERLPITLTPLSHSSSLTISDKNNLNKTYYEND